jgi:flagellar hook-basal body complex protein FliE
MAITTPDTRQIDQMLATIVAGKTAANAPPNGGVGGVGGPDFAQILKSSIDQVSATQQDAHKMVEDFSSGQSNVNLQDVMINLQKASLSFQQMTQVRNKLVSAYHDIMNIQV